MIEKIPSIIMQYMPSNTTSNFNTINSVGGLFIPIVTLGIALGAIYVLFMVSASIEKYRRFKKLFTSLSHIFSYAAYGSLTVIVVGVPCLVGYWVFNAASSNPGATVDIFKPVGIIFGLFIGVTLIGYVAKNRVWKRIFKYHKEEQLLKDVKDNMLELPKVTE